MRLVLILLAALTVSTITACDGHSPLAVQRYQACLAVDTSQIAPVDPTLIPRLQRECLDRLRRLR
jgi:hypothetical protein